jgi:CDP-diglyceride synthetase
MFLTIKKVRAQIILAIYFRENNADFEYIRNVLVILILFLLTCWIVITHIILVRCFRENKTELKYILQVFFLILLFLPSKIAKTHNTSA